MYIVFSVECLKKLWKGLRDNYRRCNDRREKATRSGAAASTFPVCKFFKNLQFLKDTVSAKDTETNLDLDDTLHPDPLEQNINDLDDNDDTV